MKPVQPVHTLQYPSYTMIRLNGLTTERSLVADDGTHANEFSFDRKVITIRARLGARDQPKPAYWQRTAQEGHSAQHPVDTPRPGEKLKRHRDRTQPLFQESHSPAKRRRHCRTVAKMLGPMLARLGH